MSAGVVAALNAEARTLGKTARYRDGLLVARDGTLVAISGIGAAAAAIAAGRLADAGADALVSWGMAGGLDPVLRAGTVCLPDSVTSAGGVSFATHVHWRGLVGAAIGERLAVVQGTLLTNEVTIDDVVGKAAAFRATGAVAVDMESTSIAKVAAERSLPFIAVRVIVDTAADALPKSVAAATRDGQVSLGLLLQELARSPRDIMALLRLAARYRAAASALVFISRSGALAPLSFA